MKISANYLLAVYFVLDLIAIFAVYISIFFFNGTKKVKDDYPPFGFYCRDPKLSMSYKGDTIKMGTIIKIAWCVPLIAIVVIETVLCKTKHKLTSRLKTIALKVLVNYKNYLIGLVLALFPAVVLKCLICEPRPDFFVTCKPDKLDTCITGEFVTNFTCTNPDKHLVNQSFLSFPSGHSAFSVFVALYLALYIQTRLIRCTKRFGCVGIFSMLQVVILTAAYYVCVSRVTDSRHHWWDVLTGAFIGAFIAYYVIYIVCDGFQDDETPAGDCVKNEQNGHDMVLLKKTRGMSLDYAPVIQD